MCSHHAGYLNVELRTSDSRPINTMLNLAETPGLAEAFEHLRSVAHVACEAMFLDLTRMEIPDTAPVVPDPERRPCRICDVMTVPVYRNGKPYCEEHAPAEQ